MAKSMLSLLAAPYLKSGPDDILRATDLSPHNKLHEEGPKAKYLPRGGEYAELLGVPQII